MASASPTTSRASPLILHTVAMLQKLNFKDYGTLTVLINGDEEISSPGSRSTITRMAGEQDVVFSFEGGGERRHAAPGHQRHRRGLPDGGRQGLARGLGAGQAASMRCTSCRTSCCR